MSKIRFGIIGTGLIAKEFANSIKKVERAELKIVNSRKNETANKFILENDLKNAKPCENIEEMIGKVDAVYIATPNGKHYEYAKFFLSNKINVLIEKPMTLNLKEAVELVNISLENDVYLMEAFKTVHLPQYKILKEETLKQNFFGGHFSMNQYSSRMNDIKNGIYNSVFDAELGKGSTYDMLIYPVELAISLFGNVEKVNSFTNKLPNGVDITNFVTLKHENGKISNIICSKETGGKDVSELYSQDLTINFDTLLNLNKINSYIPATKEEKELFNDKNQKIDFFVCEINDFIDIINNKNRILSDYYNDLSLESLRILNIVENNG